MTDAGGLQAPAPSTMMAEWPTCCFSLQSFRGSRGTVTPSLAEEEA